MARYDDFRGRFQSAGDAGLSANNLLSRRAALRAYPDSGDVKADAGHGHRRLLRRG
jgi:hypothetical protein